MSLFVSLNNVEGEAGFGPCKEWFPNSPELEKSSQILRLFRKYDTACAMMIVGVKRNEPNMWKTNCEDSH
ncbi:2-C-methyl-D-erythritol 4-phosphate cytidylyltransferase [Dirofilaria immitis]